MEKLFHIARAGRAETGKHPKVFHDFWLRDFEWHRTEGSYFSPPNEISIKRRGVACYALNQHFVFFPGCKLGARSPLQVRDAAVFLKERYGAGVLLDCCGAPAYWAGEDKIFQEQIESLRGKWEAAEKPVFVFACAYCMRLFDGFLPEIEKVSLYELMARHEDIAAWISSINQRFRSFAMFDPCMARNYPDMENAVRKLAADGDITLTELPDKNRCCGFGGHMRTANPGLFDTIVDRRTSADEAPYLVYCANCAGTFALADKVHAHVLDLVFQNNDANDAAETGKTPQKQRDNAIRAKAALIELYEGGSFEQAARPWDAPRVKFPDSLAADMGLRLILEDDVREAIYEAERAGEVFILPGGAPGGGELRQCRIFREVVTIWVQYIKHDAGKTAADYDYTIVDVWNHRMRISDTD